MKTLHRLIASLAIAAGLLAAMPAAANLTPNELQAINDSGKAELSARHLDEALAIFRHGLDEAERADARHFIAVFLHNIGIALRGLERDDEAFESLNRSLQVYREANERTGEALALTSLSSIDRDHGRFDEALAKLTRAREIYRALGPPEEAYALGLMAGVLSRQGRQVEAIELLDQAIEMGTHGRDIEVQANNLGRRGAAERILGRYEAALRDLESARDLFLSIGDIEDEAVAIGEIASVYMALNRTAESYAGYLQALETFRKQKDPRGEAGVLNNIGILIRDQGDHETALRRTREAYSIYRRIGDPQGQVFALGNIGIILKDMGRLEEAVQVQKEAAALSRSIGSLESEASDYSNLGIALALLERFEESIVASQRSLELYAKTKTDGAWISLGMLGYAQGKLGRTDEAIASYEAALKSIEGLRAGVLERESRTAFVGDKLYVYNGYIDFLLNLHREHPGQGYAAKAFAVFERKQGRSFLEQIGVSGASRFAGVPQAVLDQEQHLRQSRQEAETELAAVRSAKAPDLQRLSAISGRIRSIEAEEDAMAARIKAEFPDYYALEHPTPAGVDALQKALKSGEFILVYDVAGLRTNLWILGQGGVFSFTLPGGREAVKRRVAEFREAPDHVLSAIADGRDVAIVARETLGDFDETSHTLYGWLIPKEAQALLAGAKLLYVVPTGPLYDLPFEALVVRPPDAGRRARYLVEDHRIAYLSSASLLDVLRQSQQRRRGSPAYPLLAFADPVFDAPGAEAQGRIADLRTQAYRKLLGGSFVRLPETGQLARSVGEILEAPAESDPLWMDESASRENVLKLNDARRLRDYRYIVFATHAVLPNEVDQVTQPALVLSHPERNGFLTMSDVFGLSLNADFVVLSACNTGRGQEVSGEGVASLTRAFMYAGTPAVSVTLWSVEAEATRQLTVALFRHLKHGKALAEALRDAKLELLDGPDPLLRHPYFWAPTILFGSGN